jgi:hypothetical protein
MIDEKKTTIGGLKVSLLDVSRGPVAHDFPILSEKGRFFGRLWFDTIMFQKVTFDITVTNSICRFIKPLEVNRDKSKGEFYNFNLSSIDHDDAHTESKHSDDFHKNNIMPRSINERYLNFNSDSNEYSNNSIEAKKEQPDNTQEEMQEKPEMPSGPEQGSSKKQSEHLMMQDSYDATSMKDSVSKATAATSRSFNQPLSWTGLTGSISLEVRYRLIKITGNSHQLEDIVLMLNVWEKISLEEDEDEDSGQKDRSFNQKLVAISYINVIHILKEINRTNTGQDAKRIQSKETIRSNLWFKGSMQGTCTIDVGCSLTSDRSQLRANDYTEQERNKDGARCFELHFAAECAALSDQGLGQQGGSPSLNKIHKAENLLKELYEILGVEKGNKEENDDDVAVLL